MSYIDKEKALEFVLNNTPHINCETTMECVERAIKEIPTADVVEVRHGEWKKMRVGNIVSHVRCSNCGEYEALRTHPMNFCPNCGAKMDGKRREG